MRFFDTKHILNTLTVLLVVAVAFALVSCDGLSSETGDTTDDLTESLSISGIQLAPDTTVNEPIRPDTVRPGDRIAIEGQNMTSVASLYVLGYEVSFNSALASEDHLIVSIPSDLEFGELSASALDTLDAIRVANRSSEAAYNEIPVLPPPPELESMSNEYADPGEEVTISGSYLYLAESVTLPDGTTIPGSEIESTPDGTEAELTIPNSASSEEGPITYETSSGSSESSPSFVFRDTRGLLLNMDDVADWPGWSAMSSADAESDYRSDFDPGAEGDYIIVDNGGDALQDGAGDGEWWTDNRTINLNSEEWIAPENLDEPAGNFAVKFELNIRETWSAGSILIHLIETADGYASGYAYRVKPWEQSDGSVSAVSWQGWRTITVPFDEFNDSYGDGEPTSDLRTLLGDDGVPDSGGPDDNPPSFRLVNYTERTVPPEQGFAIDNIRVVRINESN